MLSPKLIILLIGVGLLSLTIVIQVGTTSTNPAQPQPQRNTAFEDRVLQELNRLHQNQNEFNRRSSAQEAQSGSSGTPCPKGSKSDLKGPPKPVPLAPESMSALRTEVRTLAAQQKTPLQAITEGQPYRRLGDFRPSTKQGPETNVFHVHGRRSGYGWRFVKYVPSKMETDWIAAVKPLEKSGSFNSLRPAFQAAFDVYVKELPNAMTPDLNGGATYADQCTEYVHNVTRSLPLNEATCAGKTAYDPEVFSRFEYEFSCLDDGTTDPSRSCDVSYAPETPKVGEVHTSYIEPLVGLLRHPFVFLKDGVPFETVVDKQYMFVDKWALNHLGYRWQQTAKRSLFFDMGASTYSTGPGGASQNWFVSVMQCVCAPPTDFFLWEANPINHVELYKEVPGPFRPSYHYYNVPLEIGQDSWNNPLNVLLDKAQPGDIVVTKIDFDNGPLETAILNQMLKFKEVSHHVDELFFEHHVHLPIMVSYWGGSVSPNTYATDSIRLFQQLRERGIRAHSWV